MQNITQRAATWQIWEKKKHQNTIKELFGWQKGEQKEKQFEKITVASGSLTSISNMYCSKLFSALFANTVLLYCSIILFSPPSLTARVYSFLEFRINFCYDEISFIFIKWIIKTLRAAIWGEWVKAQQWRNGISLQRQIQHRYSSNFVKSNWVTWHFQVALIFIFHSLKDSWKCFGEAQPPMNRE